MKLHLKIIRLFSYLIPRRFRSDWTEEWSAELEHRESRRGGDLLKPSLGAFWDAIAMQSRRLEEDFWQDVRFGVRTFWGSKAVTGAVVLSLALGIGVNAALFSLTDAVLLKKLAVTNPDDLVFFQWVTKKGQWSLVGRSMPEHRSKAPDPAISYDSVFTYPIFQRVKERSAALADVFAFARGGDTPVVVDGQAELLSTQWVSGGYFGGIGIVASVGRSIVESDDSPTASPAAVLSDQYWLRRFGRDTNVIGKTISVAGTNFTVVGTTSSEFRGTLQVEDAPDIYLPISFQPVVEPPIEAGDSGLSTPDRWWVVVMARMKPDASRERLLAAVTPTFEQAAWDGFRQSVRARRMVPQVPLRQYTAPELRIVSGNQGLDYNRQTYRTPLLILSSLAAVVLLIACINVANLLLSRATTRQHEMAVRFALGAGRLRVVRQLLTESLLLAMVGGVCGLVSAYFAKDLFLRWGPWNSFGQGVSASLGLRVFAFAAGLSLVASILSGVIPAIVVTRRGLNATMKETGSAMSRRYYLSGFLLAGQAAMSVVLLIGAGLFVATVHNLKSVVIAADPDHVLQFTVDTSPVRYDRARTHLLWDQMLERIKAVPGVESATVASAYQMIGGISNTNDRMFGSLVLVGPEYFKTMGVPLLEGRDFRQADAGGPPRVVVNETFARRFFTNESPIGRKVDGEVIGVVKDADHLQFNDRSEFRKAVWPTVYTLYRKPIDGGPSFARMVFQVRTQLDPGDVLPAIRVAVHEVDPQIALAQVGTLADHIDSAIATENTFARLSLLFGGIAVLLTAIGLFGILSYNVARRIKEFGIRLGLGSRRSRVVGVVLFGGLKLVVFGVVIGLAGAFFAARYVASILFGLKSSDPRVIGAAVAVVIVVGALASLAPAWRASRVQPLDALRYE
jgi:predicted permease